MVSKFQTLNAVFSLSKYFTFSITNHEGKTEIAFSFVCILWKYFVFGNLSFKVICLCLYALSCTHENFNFWEINAVHMETSQTDLRKSPQTFFVFDFKNLCWYIFNFFLDPNKALIPYLTSFSVKVWLIHMKMYSNSQSNTIQKFIFTEFRWCYKIILMLVLIIVIECLKEILKE